MRIKSYLDSTTVTGPNGYTFQVRAVKPGLLFDTPYETGCEVITPVEIGGGFDGYDSDGVLCLFGVNMITRLYERTDQEQILGA